MRRLFFGCVVAVLIAVLAFPVIAQEAPVAKKAAAPAAEKPAAPAAVPWSCNFVPRNTTNR